MSEPEKVVYLTIYHPPKPYLPYLVAAIFSDGRVTAIQTSSLSEAQVRIAAIEKEMNIPGQANNA